MMGEDSRDGYQGVMNYTRTLVHWGEIGEWGTWGKNEGW